jgi:hypothetical protein
MIRDFSLFFALFFFFSSHLYPGTPGNHSADSLKSNVDSVTAFQLVKYDIIKSLDDGWKILKAPAHFSGKDWATAGVVIGSTALSMLLDDEIRSTVGKNHTPAMDNITKAGRYYGEVVPAVSLSAGIYATGLIFNERSVSLTGRLLAESLLYAGTINVLLKVLFSRSRPYNNKGNTDFGNYKFDNDFYSMPSGHTTVAFTVSTVLAERINNIYATIGLYGLAALTAYQRIYDDQHWFSDTVLGAALGIFISRAVVQLNTADPYENKGPDFMIIPSENGIRLGINFKF